MDTDNVSTYENAVAEMVLLSQELPVGSHWKDGARLYKVNNIALGVGVALANCTRVKVGPANEPALYDYQIDSGNLFVSDILNLAKVTEEEFDKARDIVNNMFEKKNLELFQKQCLLKMPTEEPFTDFDTLHDELIHLKGTQYFFDDSAENCLCVLKINMDDYVGKGSHPDVWHFYMEQKAQTFVHLISILPNKFEDTFESIVQDGKIYPITEYQFEELVKFIETDPQK